MEKKKRPTLDKGCLSKDELKVVFGGISSARPGSGTSQLDCWIDSCTACTACENCVALCESTCAICTPADAS